MLSYDKNEVKEAIILDNVFEILQEWGGEPEYTSFGIISATICHNHPGDGSRKLYYYENSGLFKCYTGCDDTFDVFELAIKVMKIQNGIDFDLNDAVRYVAGRFGIAGTTVTAPDETMADQALFDQYDRIQNIELKDYSVQLKEYDPVILDRMNYTVKIKPWLDEGMSEDMLKRARIGFFPGGDQITIPHYDIDGRFVGLRGRSLCAQEAERFGKYRPIVVNGTLYSHPLGMNLYNLNNSKKNIGIMQKAIIYESEKSTLLHATYFGADQDISVACCGSNISAYQMAMLQEAGAKEVIVAFDRQFQDIGDEEFKHLTANFYRIHSKYKNDMTISFIFDKEKILSYKASPIDEGPDKFLALFKKRIFL